MKNFDKFILSIIEDTSTMGEYSSVVTWLPVINKTTKWTPERTYTLEDLTIRVVGVETWEITDRPHRSGIRTSYGRQPIFEVSIRGTHVLTTGDLRTTILKTIKDR